MRAKSLPMLVLCACVCVTLAGGARSEDSEPEALAKVVAGQYGVEWYPSVDYDSVALTVSGPDGLTYRQEFSANEFPYFDFYDDRDKLRPDGSYQYELTISPVLDPQTRRSLSLVQEWQEREKIAERFRRRGALPEGSPRMSGAFAFESGTVALPEVREGKDPKKHDGDGSPELKVGDLGSEKDICYVDDLIIDGSLCTGFDCVCNYSFGFDTIVLRENNLRIFFDDTSVASAFPRNDWRIVINDSANGGAEYFGVEDSTAGRRVFSLEAGAPLHSLFVDDRGHVGFGTSIPSTDLHAVSGNTPTLRLDQDGSNGFAPQIWDLAGNETSFFLRDVTNGSLLPFRVRPGAPSSSIDVSGSGDLGLGTSSPGADVHLRRTSGDAILRLENTTDGELSGIEFTRRRQSGSGQTGAAIWLTSDSSTNHTELILQAQSAMSAGDDPVSNGKRFSLDTVDGFLFEDGNVGIDNTSPSELLVVGSAGTTYCDGVDWHTTSSRDSKKNIEELSDEDLKDLVTVLEGVDLVKYQYRNESDDIEPRVGMIAEEMPEELASPDRRGLELGRHVGFLLGVAKAMHAENQKMEEAIETMRAENEKMSRKMAELQAEIAAMRTQ